MNHTRGPWRVLNSDLVKDIFIYSIHDNNKVPICTVDRDQASNAPLIAAAPELLFELKMVVKLLQSYPEDKRCFTPELITLWERLVVRAEGDEP
jgi:hypothetical protein